MTQPFRSGNGRYESLLWPGLSVEFVDDRIGVQLHEPLQTLSSAVYGGGFGHGDSFVNWKVPVSYYGNDPADDVRSMLREWGYSPSSTIGLLTAAKLTHASIAEAEGDRFNIVCIATSGTGNAARSGMSREVFSAYKPGTINIMLFIDGSMTPSAMVNAVITATEAKTAALTDLGITDPDNGRGATGTTTDAIIIGASQSQRFGAVHAYAGAATTIGNAIGNMVYRTVYESTATQGEQ
ncbi:adenosylcobinamide amidohydrolase [Paenibacillus oenotherae]|uniref:Adenosylcobinamide amidohydrolase n=1 Tax=Paenibacillus oenotherae TaxID=1435645 RepID=A0ABS7D041_9BACL|nr:adenosylcobinamide amidohydrolase [Paenibacillus oenotherae]MBW7473184.1 adenosylcobinamide amidohydrolase [Paenibacillus oenotherae]